MAGKRLDPNVFDTFEMAMLQFFPMSDTRPVRETWAWSEIQKLKYLATVGYDPEPGEVVR